MMRTIAFPIYESNGFLNGPNWAFDNEIDGI